LGIKPHTNPETFGAALPTELPTRQGAKGYHPKTVAIPRKVFRDELRPKRLPAAFPPPDNLFAICLFDDTG
jgi:hypothetical protein